MIRWDVPSRSTLIPAVDGFRVMPAFEAPAFPRWVRGSGVGTGSLVQPEVMQHVNLEELGVPDAQGLNHVSPPPE